MGITVDARAPSVDIPDRVVYIETKDKAPREFYISKKDIEKHGFTRGCPRCSSFTRGLGRQPHTEVCRDRLKELMREESKVKNQEVRMRDFEVNQEDKRKRREDTRKRKEEGRDDSEPASKAQIIEEENHRKRKADDSGDAQTENDGDVVINQIIID